MKQVINDLLLSSFLINNDIYTAKVKLQNVNIKSRSFHTQFIQLHLERTLLLNSSLYSKKSNLLLILDLHLLGKGCYFEGLKMKESQFKMVQNNSIFNDAKIGKYKVENENYCQENYMNEGIQLVSEQEHSFEQNEYQKSSDMDNSHMNFLMDKILEENKSVSKSQSQLKDLRQQNKENNRQKQPQYNVQKRVTIRFDDIKMYNSKWISRLCQLERNINFKRDRNERVQTIQNEERSLVDWKMIKTKLLFPQWFNEMMNKEQSLIKQKPFSSSAQQEFQSHKQIMPRIYRQLKSQQIFLLVQYHSQNTQLEKFLFQPMDQQQSDFSIDKYTVLHYIDCQQLSLVKRNFNRFHEYISSKSLNQLFLVSQFSFYDVLCHNNEIRQDKCDEQNKTFKHLIKYQPTLLQKVISIRKLLKIIQSKPDLNKFKIYTNKSQYVDSQGAKLSQKSQQLYGNKNLIHELLTLYSQKIQVPLENTFVQPNKLNQNTKEYIKFVQFVPKLSINDNNYTQFINQVSQMKKTYFNGLSVGFQGFRISNFTTRSQNNITFVFHDFHELIQLQSLLIDFEFPLNCIEQIRKQYVEFPNKKLKKIKIKFHVEEKQKRKHNQSIGVYEKSENKRIDTTNNQYLAFGKNSSFMQFGENKHHNRLMNSTSFFLEPSGYYEKIQERSKEYLKEFYFYKIEKVSPDYERLIKHVNSLSSVSKTLIMPFECIFPLIRLRDSLSQLINICSHFIPTQLHILPQPLQLVRIHEDYRSNIVNLKDQVRELLENEDKFGCLRINRSGSKGPVQRLNSINSFNMVKIHEEYLMKRQLFERVHKNYAQYTSRDNPIYNSDFEEAANSLEFLLPNPKMKFEFICFPFHNRIFKIVKYFEPGTQNLLNLQLKETNERSENFLPVEEITLHQYKTKMIKQGLDFFYFSYPFGDKFKLSLQNHHIYTLTLKNQLKFNKLDHLRVVFWLGKLNRMDNKIVFYESSLTKPYLSEEKKKEYFAKTFIKQKLPLFDYVYEIGFIEDSLKSKIVQIEVYPSPEAKQKNQKNTNLIFKKVIEKIILQESHLSKSHKIQSYKIKTNRATWDLILKKLKFICNEKQNQLRRLAFSEQDDKQFERMKNSLKKTNV